MNARYRISALFVTGAAMFLTACSAFTKSTGSPDTVAKLDGVWAVTHVAGKKLEGVRPELKFDFAQRTVSGFDGCNRFGGSFTFEGERLQAKTVSTQMACTNDAARQASAEIAELLVNGAEVVDVAMDEGRVLMLKNAKAEIRMRPSQHVK